MNLDPFPDDPDLITVNAAVREGRCWRLDGCTEDGSEWVIGDRADADRLCPPGERGHWRVPADRLVIRDRMQPHQLVVVTPREDVVVDGERWPAATEAKTETSLGRLAIRHPRHGWTFVYDQADLARRLAAMRRLPPDDGLPRRIELSDGYDPFYDEVATTSWDAAGSEHMQWQAPIVVTEGVTPVHVGFSFVWWSDGRLTRTRDFAGPRPRSLEEDASWLIDEVCGSHSPEPVGGWAVPLRVAQILARETIAEGPATEGGWPDDRLLRLRVALVDGEERDLWLRETQFHLGHLRELRESFAEEWRLDAEGRLVPPARPAFEDL